MGHSSHVVVAAAVVAVVGPVIFGVADVSDAAAVFFFAVVAVASRGVAFVNIITHIIPLCTHAKFKPMHFFP